MGIYTTQIKTICESIYMNRNKLNVDDLLNDRVYEHNFNTDLPDMTPYTICNDNSVQARIFQNNVIGSNNRLYPLYDDDYPTALQGKRKDLQYKILIHYYTREICEETFALWKLRLIAKLNDIMPYYNQLYTETFEKYLGKDYNLFDNVDLTDTEDFDKKLERLVDSVLNEKMKNKNSSESSATETNSGKDTTYYKKSYKKDFGGAGYKDTHGNGGLTTVVSDTPQGSVSFDLSDASDTESLAVSGYASSVNTTKGTIVQRNFQKTLSNPEEYKDQSDSKDEYEHGHTVDNNEYTSDKGERNTDTTTNENEQAKEHNKTTKRTKGKTNYQSYASVLKEIRESIINIDKMIIDELEPLFFGLW